MDIYIRWKKLEEARVDEHYKGFRGSLVGVDPGNLGTSLLVDGMSGMKEMLREIPKPRATEIYEFLRDEILK